MLKMSQLLVVLLVLGLIGAWAGPLPAPLLNKGPRPHTQRGLGIYGGNSTTIEDHPYLVSVTWYGLFLCAGTILSSKWVFLAADCLDGYSASDMTVVAGSADGFTGTQTFSISQSVSHPDYDYDSRVFNYALVQIDGSFSWGSKVKKAKLPSRRAKVGTWLTMVGYGDDSNANDDGLRDGLIQVMNKKKCEKIYEVYKLNLTSTVGCVYNKGKTTICIDDASDPVTGDGVLYHVATSVGSSGYCSSSAMPVITSDVFGGVAWIKKITGIK